MKARVFVTLKPSVFDPQGQTIAEALHSLGYGGVADVRQGKYFELELDAGTADAGARRWRPKWRQAAREPGDRELSRRDRRTGPVGGTPLMKFAVVVFPGIELRPRRLPRRQARARPGRPSSSGTRNRPRRRRRGDPAGRLLAWRLPAHRRDRAVLAGHGRGRGVRRGRRAGARHLQRLSGSARGGPAAGRDAAQSRPEVPLRARRRPRRADRHAVHGACAPGQVLRMPIAHGEGNYYATPESLRRARGDRPDHLPLLRTPAARSTDAGQSQRIARTHRRHLQRARATSSA